nr:MAG TPA: hypothetical protein [Caudoviricetes sp.]
MRKDVLFPLYFLTFLQTHSSAYRLAGLNKK